MFVHYWNKLYSKLINPNKCSCCRVAEAMKEIFAAWSKFDAFRHNSKFKKKYFCKNKISLWQTHQFTKVWKKKVNVKKATVFLINLVFQCITTSFPTVDCWNCSMIRLRNSQICRDHLLLSPATVSIETSGSAKLLLYLPRVAAQFRPSDKPTRLFGPDLRILKGDIFWNKNIDHLGAAKTN